MRAILTAHAETQVQFHHLDPMNIVWHGNHADFFEIARVALMEKLDYSYPQMEASGYAWPVIELKVRYAHPILFRMKLDIVAGLVEWENRLKISYLIRDQEGVRLTRGHSIQVAVDVASGEMLYASPPVLLERLGVSA